MKAASKHQARQEQGTSKTRHNRYPKEKIDAFAKNRLWQSHWVSSQLNGAGSGTRTHDLLITSQLLYQLSYAGNKARDSKQSDSR